MKPRIGLKVLGILSIAVGAGLSVLNAFIEERKTEQMIDAKVEEKFNLMQMEESK